MHLFGMGHHVILPRKRFMADGAVYLLLGPAVGGEEMPAEIAYVGIRFGAYRAAVDLVALPCAELSY